MTHVNYENWAQYIADLVQLHLVRRGGPEDPRLRVMELGCGTGSIGLAMSAATDCDLVGLDLSGEMLARASRKAEKLGLECQWVEGDYSDFAVTEPVDVMLFLYDGLNYSTSYEKLQSLFECVERALRPGGLFLVDQSTPANSENNGEAFEDQGGDEAFRYFRSSHYDVDARIHRTVFRINRLGTVFEEEHLQRAYSADEIRPLLVAAGLEIVDSYDGFTTKPVSGISERIQWVTRKPLTS